LIDVLALEGAMFAPYIFEDASARTNKSSKFAVASQNNGSFNYYRRQIKQQLRGDTLPPDESPALPPEARGDDNLPHKMPKLIHNNNCFFYVLLLLVTIKLIS
jgi:hypothetical protein